jgi:DNA processing protein
MTPCPEPGAGETASLAALLTLPGMGPHRLDAVLVAAGGARAAWQAISGRPQPDGAGRAAIARCELRANPERLLAGWRSAAAAVQPEALLAAHRAAGVALVARGTASYPPRLDHPEDPRLLFCRGDLAALDAPTVAIVGTRRATPYGLRVARQWGRQLSEAGIAVVSGLARGIDAAAHAGALEALGEGAGGASGGGAAPVAVVGTGLDVVYPASSTSLWHRVAAAGLLVSEAPLGARAERWRFPSRNRIIAGLADATVVVESQARGGSLSTAASAEERHRPVLVVPGSVFAPTSAGTHELLRSGHAVAAALSDVLDAVLGVGRLSAGPRPAPGAITVGGGGAVGRTRGRGVIQGGGALQAGGLASAAVEQADGSPADPAERTLLAALGWEPAVLDDLVDRTGWSLGTTCTVLERLLRRGRVGQNGPWFTQEGE